jgi:cysteine synthase A
MTVQPIFQKIGNTPIVKLKNKNIFVKLEQFNLGGSVKARVAYSMINEALKNGELQEGSGQTVLEASGGNTAIGLAILCSIYGFKLKLVIPDNYSKKKIEELKIYGADVVLSDHTVGNNSHVIKAREIKNEHPEYIYVDQLNNSGNPKIHYRTTGQEIAREFNHIDYFITGIGSGGTITGVGKRLKEEFNTKIIGVLPADYSIEKEIFIPHKIQGIGIGMLPPVFDDNLVDAYINVSYEETMNAGQYLIDNEGLFLGISSAANVAASMKLYEDIGASKNIVTISPDGGDSYLENYKEFQNANN